MFKLEKLDKQLELLISSLPDSDLFRDSLKDLISVYPFNQYEYIISTLLSRDVLTYEQYLEIRDNYINRNLFLYVFEISAPRGFGDTWAFSHLISVEPDLKRPSKKVDPEYRGEYDLFLNHDSNLIKIEVKASRAVDRTRPSDPLYIKALSSDTEAPFLMNFQQLKPSCCHVFLWIAVYRDTVKYWVLNSEAVKKHKDFTPQHRNESTSTRVNNYNREDIFEGQIMITESNVESISNYQVSGKELLDAIKNEYCKLQKS